MIRALVSVRFRALFAGLTRQSQRKQKKSTGMTVLMVFLYLYLLVIACGFMVFLFHTLAKPYHALGLDWLYFAMAGSLGLAFSVLGSVFTTQNQLYDAKDNPLLLAMPIPPRLILLSRMLPLLGLNLLFAGLVILPAAGVYAVEIGFSAGNLFFQLLSLLGICLLTQAIACLLGWLLHLLLRKMNKSLASVLYLTVFLGLYFYSYSQAGKILGAMTQNSAAIATVFEAWVWPLYAMGTGCMGDILRLLAFLALCAAAFGAMYAFLSATFLRSAAAPTGKQRKRSLDLTDVRTAAPAQAVIRKEGKKFLSCPVYLTNMGLGIAMTAALPVLGLVFRRQILEFLPLMAQVFGLTDGLPALLITALLASMISLICISTPSVSLEGKNIWILKSMPLTGKQILLAKLRFHCRLAVPAAVLSGLILAATFGCPPVELLLCGLIPGLLALFVGLLGLICGLRWGRLDWISEAYPCKQSVSVLVTMFTTMSIPLVLGILYVSVLRDFLSAASFLSLCGLLLVGACLLLHHALLTWGVRKWEALSA